MGRTVSRHVRDSLKMLRQMVLQVVVASDNAGEKIGVVPSMLFEVFGCLLKWCRLHGDGSVKSVVVLLAKVVDGEKVVA